MTDISTNDILEAIRLAIKESPSEEDAGCLTARELSDTMHISPMMARRGLSRLMKTGEIEMIRVQRVRYDGVVFHTNGFRPKA